MKKYKCKKNKINNYFADGSFLEKSQEAWENAFAKDNLPGTIGALGSGIAPIIGVGTNLAKTADADDLKNKIESNILDTRGIDSIESLENLWENYSNIGPISYKDVRGLTNRQAASGILGAGISGGVSGSSIGGGLGAVLGAGAGILGGTIGTLIGNAKARRETKELNKLAVEQNKRNLAAANNAASNINTQQGLSALGNYKAKGGPIHIKKENEGKFTASAKRAGMGVQEFASHVLANKDEYSPLQVKRANFAKVASSWHELGGPLQTNGADWDGGLTYIGNGGTHEENPNEGVQIGVDAQGVPNLLEEGEVLWKDANYVFSDRLKPSKEMKNKYKLKGDSYADVVKHLQKESEERPNDPISKRGLDTMLTRLASGQEEERMKKEINRGSQYAHGGKLGNHYDGLGDKHNYLSNLLNTNFTLKPAKPNLIVPEFTGPSKLGPITGYGVTFDGSPLSKEELNTYNKNMKDYGRPIEGKKRPTWLRYAPVIGATLGSIASIFDKPDYTQANIIAKEARRAGDYTPVKAQTVGNYLTYNPFDRDFYSNKLRAEAASGRRAIANEAGGNRASAMAGLIASDYNTQGKLGDLFRQAEEYNAAQRERVEGFNRGTNQFNAESIMRADMANQSARQAAANARLSGITQAAQMRTLEDSAVDSSRIANFTNLFNSLGDIGREQMAMKMIEGDRSLLYDWYGRYRNASESEEKKNKKSNKGKGGK